MPPAELIMKPGPPGRAHPTSMPVLKLATAATSGITRMGLALIVPSGSRVARLSGTTPRW